MVEGEMMMTCEADRFTYTDACHLSRKALHGAGNRRIALGMGRVRDTSVAALARLVVLRRDLLRTGRDLRLLGLGGRAEAVYMVHHLERFLPRQTAPSRDNSTPPAQNRRFSRE